MKNLFYRGGRGWWWSLATFAALAVITSTAVFSITDTDGDGLSDGDEVAIYHTDPNKFDTDGDGMGDGDEVRAGTDPLNPLSVFKLLGPLEKIAGGWRIKWQSVPGRIYKIQRAGGDQLNRTNWVEIGQVTAAALASSFDDTTATNPQRFYRVTLETIAAASYYQGNPDRFVPLNSQGQPIEGGLIPLNPDDSLTAFEFRPAGRSLAGSGQGFFIRFPAGAKVVTISTVQYLEFTSATAGFGAQSPFQLASPLTINGPTAHIPLNQVDVAGVAAAFGIQQTNGLDIRLFGLFPLRLFKGFFDDAGLRGAQLGLPDLGLPLPGSSGNYSDFLLDISAKGGIKIPFAGEFSLADRTSFGPRLTVATNRPIWIELKANGAIALGGRADIAFSNGPNFSVDFGLDDPNYHLQMSAGKVHVPLLSSLVDLLPAAPTVADTTDAAQLNLARSRLVCFDRALVNFSAATVGAAPASADSQPTVPAQALVTATSVLDAWGLAATCSSGGISPSALLNSLRHAGQSASGARDLKTAVCEHLSLMRLKGAFAGGGLTSDPQVLSELETALTQARAATVVRARNPDALQTLDNLREVLRCLLEIDQLRQQLGLAVDTELVDALRAVMQKFVSNLIASQQVQAGVYIASGGSPIAAMDRFTALDYLRQMAEVLQTAQLLGIDSLIGGPVGELKGQLAMQAWAVINANILAAEAAGDYTGFNYAAEDALEIAALNMAGFLPQVGALASLPGTAFLNALPGRLNAVFILDLAKPVAERSLSNQRQDLRRLTKILHQLPGGFSYSPTPIQRAYDRLETTMGQLINLISTLSMSDLNALLDAGIVHAELRDRFSLAAPVSWENARLSTVVTRIATLGQQTNGWSELHDGIGLLIAEADRQGTNNNLTARQLYLSKAAQLAAAARAVAVALWTNESTRRNANPLLQLADLFLPGDINIDRVAGAVSYNRLSRLIEGSFSGDLRLPKFGVGLHIQDASISSGGAFNLNLYGQAGLGPTGNSLGTVSIPARRPLAISFTPPSDLRLAGGLKLALNNGMSFEAYGSMADPVYNFGFSAAGLRFDLATNLFGYIPEPVPGRFARFGPRVRTAFADYLSSLSATAEPLTGLADGPAFADLGEPPDFSDSVFTVSTDPLNAAVTGIAIVLGGPFVLGYVAADATAAQIKAVVTPKVRVLVEVARKEMDHARRDVDKARVDFNAATGSAKEEARVALATRLKKTAEALKNLVKTRDIVVQKQQAGELDPTPDTNPAETPEAAAISDELNAAERDAMNGISPALALDIELGLLDSMIDYVSTTDALGGTTGDFPAAAAAYVDNAKKRVLPRYGFDEGGVVTNAVLFNSLSDDQLKEAATVVSRIQQVSDLSGVPDPGTTYQNVMRASFVRRHDLKAQEIQAAQTAAYRVGGNPRDNVDGLRQEKLIQLYQESGDILAQMTLAGVTGVTFTNRFDGSPGNVSGDTEINDVLSALGTSYGKLANYMDSSSSEFDVDYFVYTRNLEMKFKLKQMELARRKALLEHAQTNAVVTGPTRTLLRGGIDAWARGQFTAVQQWAAASPTMQFNLRSAERLGRDLLDLTGLLETTGKPAPGPASRPRQQVNNLNLAQIDSFKLEIFPKYTIRITALAEAQKAWWILGRVNAVLLEGLAAKATNDLGLVEAAAFESVTNTIEAAGRVAGVLRQSLALQNRPIDLPLPGDIYVQKVFGDVFYNRATGLLRATFGGRVEFPDLQNAFFEISNATIDNNLNFSIDAATGGPLPFNGVTAGGTVHVSGGLSPAPLVFQGTGTLVVTNGPTVNVALSWNSTNHVLSFETQAGQLQSLRFSDNLVLFDAGFGFTVRPDTQSGELRANGSAGFFSKGALPAAPKSTNFHLFADSIRAVLTYQPGQVGLIFSNGTLHLPTFFYPTNMAVLCLGTGPATGPTISLNPQNPIQATFHDTAIPSVDFRGELDFRQFGLAVPDFPGMAAAICSAQLKFSSSTLPYLTNVNASLQIPLPRSTNIVDFTNGVFTLTGFPSGRVQLRNDLVMLDVGGFKFTLLGLGHPDCPGGSGLTVYPTSGFGQLPSFKLDGGIRADAPLSMLTGTNGDQVSGLACGSLSLTNGQPPDLVVNALAFGGTFHLGSGGPVIKNALISLQNLPNLFRLDNQHQFIVGLVGSLQVPNGPEFIMQNAKFSFFDYQRLPKFSVASLGVNNESFTMLNYLPAKVKQAQLTFKSPAAELPYALYPTNIDLNFSAEIRFPASGEPIFVGAIDKVEIDFDPNFLPRVKQVDGFEIGVGGLKIPPIKEMGGRLKLGGLAAGDPAAIYIIGRLGGSYQGYQVIGQAAFNLFGPLGYCLDVNAGSVGIPLGPTGILITGANGGESFVNNNGNPCDFKTYFTTNAQGDIVAPSSPTPPGIGMTWEVFRDVVQRMEAQAATFTQNVPGLLNPGLAATTPGRRSPTLAALDNTSTINLPCPGDCPPATVNIFCQPHPDQSLYPGKVIAKFSSINESTLNGLGITPTFIQGLGSDFSSIAGAVAHTLRVRISSLTPPPDPGLLSPQAVAELGAVITNTLDVLETSFSNVCRATLANPQATESVYNAIKRLVYEGLPCPDVTMAVGGNVSYAGVSSVGYIGGKAILSTTGTAGVIGTIYVLGIPFGEAKVFVAATDAQGMPNPSICGQASVSFGPLEIGELKLSYGCPGCVDGILAGYVNMIGALSDAVLYRITSKIAPELAAQNLGRIQLLLALGGLANTKKLAFFAELANEPLSALPPDLPQIYFQGIANVYNSINPQIIACGSVGPKLFGLPLGTDLVGVKMFATKEEFAGSFSMSISMILGAYGPFVPLGDKATMSFSMAVRDAYKFVFGGLAGGFAPGSAVGYVQSAIDYMLQNTSYALDFEFAPLGFKTFDASARVVVPDLTTHPTLPWSTWVRPEDRGLTNLPSRHDLILAAIASDKLGDAVNWRGTTNDLYTVYPDGSPQRAALAGLSLQKDYFPHGGLVGGALLTLPAVLTEKPPFDKFQTVANPNASPIDRVVTALDLLQNYFLRFNTNGELAFYIPAPNPPVLYDANGLLLGQSQLQNIATNLTPQGVMDSIKSFNIANLRIGSFYPIEQAFIRGYLDGQLLGVPIVRSDVLGLPADAQRSEGFLSITSSIPNGSWLKQFIPQAALIFDVRGLPAQPIEKRFTELASQLQAAVDTNASVASLNNLAGQALTSLTADLPKVRLTADLQVGLVMPPPLADISHFTGTAQLHAFSPRFEPDYQTNNSGPLARVQREGGIAFQGSLSLRLNNADIANIPNAELSIIPKNSGLPVVSGQFIAPVISLPGLSLNNWLVDFASDPAPHFTAAGTVAGLGVNLFAIQPLSGGSLTGLVAVAGVPPAMTANLNIAPAQLVLSQLYGDRILIHGPSRNDPFTFSTSAPWNATLELTNNLTLGVAGVNFVSLGAGGLFSPISFSGSGTSSGSFTIGFGPGAGVTLFPGDATLQRAINFSAGINGSLTVNSDGTFLLTTALGGGGLNFGGIDVPAGASLTVSNNGVSISWFINNGATAATLSIGSNKQVVFSGNAEIAPLDLGIFQLAGTNGGNLAGAFNNDGFAVNSGAKLTLLANWLQNQSLALNTFTFSNNGGITVAGTAGGANLTLAGFPFDLTAFTFQRQPTNAGGAATMALSGTLHTGTIFPGFPSMNFTGQVSSAGSVFLRSSSSSNLFFSFPVQRLTNTLTIGVGDYLGQFKSEFQLGATTGLWSALGSNWFSGTISSDGSLDLSADGPTNTFAGFGLDALLFRFTRAAGQVASVVLEGGFGPPGFTKIRLRGGVDTGGGIFLTPLPPAPAAPLPYPNLNGSVSLLLTNSGVLVSGLLNQSPLPSLSLTGAVYSSGAFSLTSTLASATINGYSFNTSTVRLDRAAGQSPNVFVSGKLGLTDFSSLFISGGFTNDGTFGLSVALPSYVPAGLPINSLGGSLNWTHNGVLATGTLSGLVLTKVLPTAIVSGSIAFSPAGAKTLTALASIAPLTNNLFRLRPSSGINFTASLDNNGLSLPSGALFEFGSLLTSSASLPAITMAADGSFSVTAGGPTPLNLTLNGFGLDTLSFNLQRDSAGKISVPTCTGSLTVPKLNVPAGVTGSWTNDGTFRLAGSISGAVSLSTLGLPVGGLNGGATVEFIQNSLTVAGNLNGSIFSTLPGASIGGVLTVTPTTVILGGGVTVSPLTLGAFSIQNAGGGPITAQWTNSGIVFPANLRLFYNGSPVGTFGLPTFTNAANGDFTLAIPSSAPVVFSNAAWQLSNAYFTLRRLNGAVSIPTFNAQVTVSGFSPALNVGVSGSLDDDGTFSLANTSALSGNFNALGSSFGVLALASLNFDNTSLRVGGTLSGGALAGVNSGVTATGSIRVTTSGQLFPSASVTFPDLQLPDVTSGFRLLPLGGGNFSAILNETGVILPSGARLFWRGSQLGTFSVPSFTIPSGGNFSVGFGPVGFDLDGYSLGNVSATLARTGATTILTLGGSSSLTVPGFVNLNVTVSGALTNGTTAGNGSYLLTGSAGSPSFPPGFSFASLNSAGLIFARTSGGTVSLQLSGSVAGGALNGLASDDLRLVNAAVTVAVNTVGQLSFSGSFQVRPISVSGFTFEGSWLTNNGWISASMVNGYLQLSGARLRSTVAGLFAVNIPLPAINVPFDGNFNAVVGPPDMTIWGFPFTGINFNFKRSSPNFSGIRMLSFENFAGNFNRAGFGQRFNSGTIFADGGTDLNWAGALSLDGFASSAGSGYLELLDGTLYAGGAFNLTAVGHTFNSGFQFDGTVDTGGKYDLTGTASLNFGGANTASSSFRFKDGSITGSTSWSFGTRSVSGSVGLNSGGIAYSFGTSDDSGWHFVSEPGIYARMVWSLSVTSSDLAGNASGNISADVYQWNSNLGSLPSGVSGIGGCQHLANFSGSIGSNGEINATMGACGINFPGFSNFKFDLW